MDYVERMKYEEKEKKMRKVFLFWGIIFFILILGVAAIIYGKIVLKAEEERVDKIRKGLALPKTPTLRKPPALPTEVEIEEVPARIEVPEPIPPLDVESLKAPESTKLPEVPEGEIIPPLPPELPEIPTLPEIP